MVRKKEKLFDCYRCIHTFDKHGIEFVKEKKHYDVSNIKYEGENN